jgi:hypothetical protein
MFELEEAVSIAAFFLFQHNSRTEMHVPHVRRKLTAFAGACETANP